MYLGKSKLSIILVVFLFFSTLASGQTGKSVRYRFNGDLKDNSMLTGERSIIINYRLPELTIENIINDNGLFYRITAPGHSFSRDPGKPELPVLSRLIEIPEGIGYQIVISEVESSIINPSVNDLKGILLPAQHGETKQKDPQKPGFVIDRELYKRTGTIKKDTVRIESIGKMRGRNLSNLLISPVSYNPASNSLEVITSMKIEILLSADIISRSKSSSSESALFNETFDKGVLNFSPEDLITGYSDQPVEMIIVTDTAFRAFLEPWYRWKRQKGFRLEILYYGAGMAGSNFNELKQSIDNVYKASSADGHPPEYLLIVGDVEKIPYYGTGNITDMYYGEFDGNGDYIPDMYIGRIPAKDTTSVKSVVTKLLEYEKFQFTAENRFYSKALTLAGKDASYASYMNGQVKYAITNYLTPANRINEFHFYYPDGYTKKDSVMKLISEGLSFINYSGHGTSAGWMHIDIKSPDVRKLTNKSMYPFIISNACRTAQFNDTASFGNKMSLASEKGAIGFIGCSNDSYWDEDFAWAIGSGTPNSDPKYSETGLGALDRLFHTHGESPSDWYITMGQVNFAGNMAVSSTPSLKKKYYWETYALLGDPSIIPVIGTPEEFTIPLPDTLPRGMRSWSLAIDPFAYIAVSDFENLWDASFASPSGSVVLDLPVAAGDSCLVVITGQNKKPLFKTIYFSEQAKEFINLASSGINDITGNNNGEADYGETFYLKLKISNLGLATASNLTASISSVSPWVTISNFNAPVGTLYGKSEVILDNVLQLTLDDNVPDMGIFTIDLTLKDNTTEKKYKIDITVHAPKLEIISCIIDDSVNGNNNFVAEPGENFNLVFQIMNRGSSSTSGQFFIETRQPELEIVDHDIKSGTLQFGEISDVSVGVRLDESAQYGDNISLLSTLDCSPFIVKKDFLFRVGKIRESFESSTFRVFPWINLSEKPWTITSTNSTDGSLSARSGAISHNASTSLIMRTYFPNPDTVKFYFKVSCEPNYDYFLFRLNDTEIVRKSGESGWELKSVPVPAGLNILEWSYKKDNSVSQFADGAWIDLIDFSGSVKVDYIQKDLETARIISPVQKEIYGQEVVSVKVLNTGRDTLNGFNLGYSINDKMPVVQHFNNVLLPFRDSVAVEFERRADLDLSGTYNLKVFGYDNGDDYLLNDTLTVSIVNAEIEESVTLFPNPFSDHLNIIINSKDDRKVRVTLSNVAGMQVYRSDEALIEGENQILINTFKLSPALYILNITGGTISKAFPLIKLKQ